MTQEAKIELIQLDKMLRQGSTQKECADYFKVSAPAVSQAQKRLKTHIIRTVALEKSSQVMESHLDMMGQLRKVNNAINGELDRAQRDVEKAGALDKKGIQEVMIKLSAEIRKQLTLQLAIAEVWHDQKIVSEFQREVLGVLNEADPQLRHEVIKRLKEKRILRGSVTL